MDRQGLLDWITAQNSKGEGLHEERASRLLNTLDRFTEYLIDSRGIEQIEDTTLEALHACGYGIIKRRQEHVLGRQIAAGDQTRTQRQHPFARRTGLQGWPWWDRFPATQQGKYPILMQGLA